MGDLPDDVPELNTAIRKQTVRPVKLHRLRLEPEDVTLVDGLPTTTPERTIADLIRAGHDLSHVADATRDGVRSGFLDRRKLCEQLERVASRTGHTDGRDLLENLLDLAGLSVAAAANSKLGRSIADSAVRQYQAALANMLEAVTPEIKNLVQSSATVGLPEFAAALQSAKQSLDVSRSAAAQAAALQTFSSMLPKDTASDDLIRGVRANALVARDYAAAANAANQQLEATQLPETLHTFNAILPEELISNAVLDTLPFLQTGWVRQAESWEQAATDDSSRKSKRSKQKDAP
jgi:hypothetical protein